MFVREELRDTGLLQKMEPVSAFTVLTDEHLTSGVDSSFSPRLKLERVWASPHSSYMVPLIYVTVALWSPIILSFTNSCWRPRHWGCTELITIIMVQHHERIKSQLPVPTNAQWGVCVWRLCVSLPPLYRAAGGEAAVITLSLTLLCILNVVMSWTLKHTLHQNRMIRKKERKLIADSC